jgi:hypothetical protein
MISQTGQSLMEIAKRAFADGRLYAAKIEEQLSQNQPSIIWSRYRYLDYEKTNKYCYYYISASDHPKATILKKEPANKTNVYENFLLAGEKIKANWYCDNVLDTIFYFSQVENQLIEIQSPPLAATHVRNISIYQHSEGEPVCFAFASLVETKVWDYIYKEGKLDHIHRYIMTEDGILRQENVHRIEYTVNGQGIGTYIPIFGYGNRNIEWKELNE